MSEQNYSASSIQVLEGLEAVRKRPWMYIGSTWITGLHHMIWEIVDNSIDEAMAGHATFVEIRIKEDWSVEVEDDGRWIPVDKHQKTWKSALETVMTVLHAWWKFWWEDSWYKVSWWLHWVWASVVNALSNKTCAYVHKDWKVFYQEYAKWKIVSWDVEEIWTTKKRWTIIQFWPDDSIFESIEFDVTTVINRIRQQAYLTKWITISVKDERVVPAVRKKFYFEWWVKSYVQHLNRNKNWISQVFHCEAETAECSVEIWFQYNESFNENVLTFANNILTPEWWMHLTWFKTALTRTINSYAKSKEILKEKDSNLTADDVREWLTAIISIKIADPQFEWQTKWKLWNPEVRWAVEKAFWQAFSEFLEENPNDWRSIISKALLASRARIAARAARDTVIRKWALEWATLPWKLADCSSRKPEDSEIYIVEWDSAWGSAKMWRDRQTQAILPLRGKVLNVEQARLDKILWNNEIKSLIIALWTWIWENFNLEKLRYHKVVLMTDADVDGLHIRTLLCTLFFRYFKEIIEKWHLYIAQPPLFKIWKWKNIHYAYSDDEKTAILKANWVIQENEEEVDNDEFEEWQKEALESAGFNGLDSETSSEWQVKPKKKSWAKWNIQRYKGLWEMNPDQLWDTTMDPDVRKMLKVTIDDAEEADKIFETLMWAEVAPRRHFIQTHAKDVKDLDI